ncbi:MAG: ATP-binding protein, partial [Proteobacteria bacterium]|nr:ATP-binding protein [Pseudomonadota bacterium]
IVFFRSGTIEADFNPAFCDLLGYSREELINPKILATVRSSDDAASDSEKANEVMRTGISTQFERAFFHKNGSNVPTHITLFSIGFDAENVHRVAGIVRDNRIQVHAHREILNAKHAELCALKAKAQFLANMSHEIRTPLNGIIGLTNLLSRITENAESADYVEGIRSSSEHLLTLVNEILDFSRLEAGGMTLESIEFQPRQIVEEVYSLLAADAKSKSIGFTCDVKNHVPRTIFGDPTKLRQILFNLASNALKFTSKGSVDIVVHKLGTDGNERTLCFRVSDSGIGVSPEALKRIFLPFSQADNTTTRKYGGTGLGLSISQNLAELMGGTIKVESALGRGSTFSLEAPFDVGLQAQEVPRTNLTGTLVLWRGGEPTVRKSLEDQLQSRGLLFQDEAETAILANSQENQIVMQQAFASIRMSYMNREEYLSIPFRQSELYSKVAGLVSSRSAASQDCHGVKAFESSASGKHPEFAKGTRILVVDDNRINQKVAIRMLQVLGIYADSAANGLEAVEAVRLLNYDLVLMDCLMPDMDGFEATREIRKMGGSTGSVPIVAMTANSKKSSEASCLETGMNAFLEKPIRIDALASVLEAWIPRNRSSMENSDRAK